MGIFAICFGIFYLFFWHSKVQFIELRKGREKLIAEVYEYRKEWHSVNNEHSLLNYPYVFFEGKDRLHKLKYASGGKVFRIGTKVPVFWYGGVLYYWHAMDRGIHRFVPSRWDFWNYKKG